MKQQQLPAENSLDILKGQVFSHYLQVDFHGVYGTAHSAADMGGDVINVFRGDYSYVKAQQWCVLYIKFTCRLETKIPCINTAAEMVDPN